jgi:peptidoglycan-N-acetylglucosamine deacetylase
MTSTNKRPYCTISVDVDSFDSLLKFNGLKRSDYGDRDPVYELAVPRLLALFDEYGIKATFFVVASDCHNSATRQVLGQIIEKGHEIANHSLDHRFAFSLLSRSEKEKDIAESTEIIKNACGKAPVGFRVPGYDVDEETIDILDRMGYSYDSSLYKFFLYPIMRRGIYVSLGEVPKNCVLKNMPSELFYAFSSPMRPYSPMPARFWRKGSGRNIMEVPLTVIPFLGMPFNTTFLFLLGTKLFDFGCWCTRKSGANLNYSFHSTDMLSAVSDKLFFNHPGLNLDLEVKKAMFRDILEKIKRHYECVTLQSFCAGLRRENMQVNAKGDN